MTRCRECGKRTWFNDLCSDCQAKQGSGRLLGGFFGSSRKTSVSIRSWTMNVTGEGANVSEGAPSLELLRGGASERGLSEHQLQGLLDGASHHDLAPHVVETLTKAGLRLGAKDELHTPVRDEAHGPVQRVTCPGCGRTVADRKGWCMYCGTELKQEDAATNTSQEEANEKVDDVDRAFLKEDVRPTEPTEKNRVQEDVRESYRDRLSDL